MAAVALWTPPSASPAFSHKGSGVCAPGRPSPPRPPRPPPASTLNSRFKEAAEKPLLHDTTAHDTTASAGGVTLRANAAPQPVFTGTWSVMFGIACS